MKPRIPCVAAHEAAVSIGHYCSTRFQVSGTDNDVHPMLDIPWFAEAIQKAMDDLCKEHRKLERRVKRLERFKEILRTLLDQNASIAEFQAAVKAVTG